jgi:hypothetical protein
VEPDEYTQSKEDIWDFTGYFEEDYEDDDYYDDDEDDEDDEDDY